MTGISPLPFPSLILMNLNLKHAVDSQIISIGGVPSDILIHGHLAYISNFRLAYLTYTHASIIIVNLELTGDYWCHSDSSWRVSTADGTCELK